MPKRVLPTTFDQHLGAVIDGMSKPFGGRAWLVTLMDWSGGTVERRVTGRTEFTVKELTVVAEKMNVTRSTIVEQALRNYSGGSVEDGVAKLIAEVRPEVSEAIVSLDERRSKSIADMSDEELEGLRSVANKDKGIGHDESDPA